METNSADLDKLAKIIDLVPPTRQMGLRRIERLDDVQLFQLEPSAYQAVVVPWS